MSTYSVLIRTLEDSHDVVITESLDGAACTLTARSESTNEQWVSTAESQYDAAVALAELLGFDLMDG